jgi:hypothetical protein
MTNFWRINPDQAYMAAIFQDDGVAINDMIDFYNLIRCSDTTQGICSGMNLTNQGY